MPIYDFECPKCGKELEVFKRMDDPNPVCEDDETEMKQVIKKVSARKGAGLWSADYGSHKTLKD